MSHALILGQTGSGKTTLARSLAGQWQQAGHPALVCDPVGDPWPGVAYWTRDARELLRVAQSSQGCAVFVDESGVALGHGDELSWFATRSRHLSHNVHFLAQRAVQISPTVRGQCMELILFRVDFDDAKTLSREWCEPRLATAHELKLHTFYHFSRFGTAKLGKTLANG